MMERFPIPESQIWPWIIGAAIGVLLAFVIARWGDRWPVLLVFLAVQSPAPDPHLLALLDAPGQSTVTWQADRRLCLYYQGAFDACYPAGRVTVTFGHVGTLDGTLRPALQGVYVLADPASGATWRAAVRRRAVYLAVWRA